MAKKPRLIVVTGGPGAGKTAVLELARRTFGKLVRVLPESASLLFSGGFPRGTSLPAKRGAQRAIFFVQRELERIAMDEASPNIILCDRGTIDGLAYWTGSFAEFFREIGTEGDKEISRYSAVIHMRVPDANEYNRCNPFRIESWEQAREIDRRIAKVWGSHPHRHSIDGRSSFPHKAEAALEILRAEIDGTCVASDSSQKLRATK